MFRKYIEEMEENPTPTSKKKAKRPDVQKRLEENKDTEFTCIKSSWKSFCKNSLLEDTIVKDILPRVNTICFLSYKLLNYHIVRLLEGKKPLPEIKQNLFYQACCMVSQVKEKKITVDTENELYISFTHLKEYMTEEVPARDYLCLGYITNLNKQQITMTHNHLKLNFYKRFRTYLKLRTGETNNSVVYHWLKDIYEEKYEGKNPFVLYMRQWLKYTPTENNIQKHSEHFLTIYYKILKEFEKYPDTKGVRTFSLLPHKHGFTQSHITICNSGLENTLKYIAHQLKKANKSGNKELAVENFEKNKKEYWNALFDIQRYETCRKKFGYTILTDGKSVVLQMKKPKRLSPKIKDYRDQSFDRFVGIDPGIRALMTSYDSEKQVVQITTREYRHKSKMSYACKKRVGWYKNWECYEEWKNIPTIKASQTKVMKEYFAYVFPKMKKFTEFHLEKGFRNLNFTSYCRSKSILVNTCQRIAGKQNTLVGFGDYSQQHGLVKNHPTTPILKLKKELHRYCKVVEIDEYKTSKVCSSCHEDITLYRNRVYRKKQGIREEKARMSSVHSVVRCRHNECSLCCMDRDINASKNILHLLELQYEGKARPKCFRPDKKITVTPPS